jgi:hypothetical protein
MKVQILIGLLVLAGSLAAQTTTGEIVGTVRDATGAVVPGVLVTLKEMGTGATTQTRSDTVGDFIFPLLKPAVYQITAEKEGFQKSTISDIRLLVGYRVRVDVRLELGQVQEVIEVTSTAVLLESQSASLGQVIDEKKIRDLPLNGRNFMQLAHISAGVIPLGIGNSPATAWTGRPDQSVSISGQRESSNSYLLDGIETRNSRFGSTGIRPSIDAIQEFRVQRNTFTAEFGRGTAVINTALKSGSNQFHATLFEFWRNNRLDARNFFDVGKRPPFRQNNFGAAVGGPILKDKLFYFGDYEGFRQRLARELRGFYPTPAQLDGDLSDLTDSLGGPVTVLDPLNNAPFPRNRIPAERFSTVARNLKRYIPQPNFHGDPRFNTMKTASRKNDFDQFNARVDQNISERSRAFYRVSFANEDIYVPALAVLRGERFPQRCTNIAISETHLFSPTLVNELRFGYNRSKTFRVSEASGGANIAKEVGLKNTTTNPFSFGVPNVHIGGFDSFGSIPQSIGAIEQIFQWTNHLSWVRGKHTLKAGADVRYDRYFQDTNFAGNPSFTFVGQYVCRPDARGAIPRGCSIGDFLLGFPATVVASVGDSRQNLRSWFYGLYIQDDYRLTKSLTLNLGLRYEYEAPPTEANDRGKIFDFTTLRVKVAGKDTRRSLVYPDRNNFQPRIGLAWTPLGPKTVFRTGFGVYTDLVNWNEQQFHVIGPPFFQSVTLTGLADRPNLRLDDMLPELAFVAAPTLFTLEERNRNPYVFQWSFSIQREVTRDFVVELGYAGSTGRKLGQRRNPNAGGPDTPGGRTFGLTVPIAERRPIRGFGDFLLGYNGGNSYYNAFTLRAEKGFSHGFSLLGSYTWSKSLDQGHTDEFSTHPMFLKFDRGPSTFDARHRLVLSYIWELPFGRNQRFLSGARGVLDKIVSGWQINGVTTFQTGQHINVGHGGLAPIVGSFVRALADRVGPGNCRECRKNIRKTPYLGPYFRLEDFRIPAPRTFGNSGRNVLVAPGLNNWDFSVFKTTYLNERLNVQFRAEFFNFFNHAQFGVPVTAIGHPNYGRILSARESRSIQLGLRLHY